MQQQNQEHCTSSSLLPFITVLLLLLLILLSCGLIAVNFSIVEVNMEVNRDVHKIAGDVHKMLNMIKHSDIYIKKRKNEKVMELFDKRNRLNKFLE